MSVSSAFAEPSDVSTLDDATIIRVREAHAKLQEAAKRLRGLMGGQDKVIDLAIIGILASGNIFFVGPPGTGKTTLALGVSDVMGLNSKRIQCTPDLFPSDIIGSEVANKDAAKDPNAPPFIFMEGPIFTQCLFVDEINRANPKTQSALLQAMQEQKVTAGGRTYFLPQPFLVLATQNPYDGEGTYPLPQAQLDRFLMCLEVGNVDRDISQRIAAAKSSRPAGSTAALYARAAGNEDLTQRTGSAESRLSPVLGPNDLILFQHLVGDLPLPDIVRDKIVDLVRFTRPGNDDTPDSIKGVFKRGADGERSVIALSNLVKARALFRGEFMPDLSDLEAVAVSVLAHRTELVRGAVNKNLEPADRVKELVEYVLQ